MRRHALYSIVWLLLALVPAVRGQGTPDVRSYAVDQAVSDFPAADDSATPEAAYATINRQVTQGAIDWPAVSVKRLASQMQASRARPRGGNLPPDEAQRQLSAHIIEVRVFRESIAAVFAQQMAGQQRWIDIRWFELEDGHWLNSGNARAAGMEAAGELFLVGCSARLAPPRREPVEDPAAHLKPYTNFLSQSGQPPEQFILDAIARHKLTIIGELHHRPTYWALSSRIVQDPRFADHAGTIYMELPMHDQALVDQFLANPALDTAPVVQMLRDVLWMGWPDQAMLDFFVAVWQANQALPAEKRLRIMLVDMARPWNQIRRRDDWRNYDTDRDKLMADNIRRDMDEAQKPSRHALFIVGYAHVATLGLRADPSLPARRTAGWRLRQAMGREMFTILQHGPVITNNGQVFGRLALGLFDAAFEANGHKPVAFALAGSPFGSRRFDADPEETQLSDTLYSEAFDAYLYLGRLEEERFSPLIDGFYTDGFVKELDRRHRMMEGTGLVRALDLPRLDGESFAKWMGQSWGQPRDWIRHLGPTTAWHYGDDWRYLIQREQHRRALADAPTRDMLKAQAQRVFDTLRTADYSTPQVRQVLRDLNYRVAEHHDAWMEWVAWHFINNPIRTIDLDEMRMDSEGRPAVPYTLTLADGSRLTGTLPYEFDAASQSWQAVEGLDWHIKRP